MLDRNASLVAGLVLVSLLIWADAKVAVAAEVGVRVEGIKPGTGSLRVALYRDPDSFRREARAVAVLSVPARSNVAEVTFHQVPAGRYAVVAYHDGNDNKKLDLTLGMFPEEGWGLSNDPKVFGPPRFADSAFDVIEPNTTIAVPLHY
ncbi:Uncharacterized conserved protein, DUF2141 family [Enhydrobacter aerosaccus]|uniref:Uncharacterized conserved protein, DUF2141 family n=1 Tax=Enhydrobacter aerosaccus TaxID=225324 RepID=A0A1T4R413_9HYPH|nr:DUF2141 domain-containing protein [Enhydrobacter aerosaccus]SKA10595.1 Uncharacterized conserved protein, DUF2141 family [Enhydrobacter aerosaccus]